MSEVSDATERRRDPGPSGREYAEAAQRQRIRTAIGFALLGVVATLAVISVVVALSVRSSSIRVCEINRAGQALMLRTQIENLRTTEPALFPDIPRATFDALVAERLAKFRAELKVLDPQRCEEDFDNA